MAKQHHYYANLDIAKTVLALLVVTLHVFLNSPNPKLYPLLNPVTRIAVPTFFILSSYFFFRKIKGVNWTGRVSYLRHAELRYIGLYVFWFVVLLPITLIADRGMISSGRQFVTQLLFNSTFADSWYIMALILGIPIILILTKLFGNYGALIISIFANGLALFTTNYANTVLGLRVMKHWYALPITIYPYQAFPVALLWIVIGKLFADEQVRVNRVHLWRLGAVCSIIALYIEQQIVLHMHWDIHGDAFFMLIPTCFFVFGLLISMGKGRISSLWLHAFATVTYCLHGSLIRVANIIAMHMHFQMTTNLNHLVVWILIILTCTLVTLVLTKLASFKPLKWLRFAY